MGRVQVVFLDGTEATDVHLAQLKGLTDLKEVYASNPHVTSVGISDLLQVRPNVRVHR